ncbi:hypothetical protein A2771_01920 [Candidatus Woesebacteria bacterium RIFCSPHIGHO2_01_FULL_38_26b]|uniref:Glycosyl transferase n=1 Tax=Candidatus Woesebacteria bacterium RIFCSPHIGHO2_01_FULL_38_26b TaxID=1802491 RepID=A0A1F7XVA5_9BACT|nr:MAG: hypothetical protein A2771_01920 [Candidatus Woesebacteria bacterium RIFCSPHIGHO2_01_FULL_38_26b]
MVKKRPEHGKILGINVVGTQISSVLRQVQVFVANNKKFLIVTPNPEQLVLAQDDIKYAKILNSAEISVPDGIGLSAAYKLTNLKVPKSTFLKCVKLIYYGKLIAFSVMFNRRWLTKDLQIIRGRDLFEELVRIANKKKWKIYLLGGWDEVAVKTKKLLEKNYRNVIIKAGTGPLLNDNGTPVNEDEQEIEEKIIKEINSFIPHLLIVGFRAPVQEKWLDKNKSKLDVIGSMVVGGAFNYLSGKYKSPPQWVANSGLEWLWRLLTGSQRLSRIINAVIIFPYRVFQFKLRDQI